MVCYFCTIAHPNDGPSANFQENKIFHRGSNISTDVQIVPPRYKYFHPGTKVVPHTHVITEYPSNPYILPSDPKISPIYIPFALSDIPQYTVYCTINNVMVQYGGMVYGLWYGMGYGIGYSSVWDMIWYSIVWCAARYLQGRETDRERDKWALFEIS